MIHSATFVFAVLVATAASVLGQGPLTPPPGTPAPTMKSLEQIEPRTPISALPITITQPGSYYLTGNLTAADGIRVSASNVTIDLNGFTIQGTGGSTGVGIYRTTTQTNTTVKNGTVRGFGFVGVSLGDHSVVEALRVDGNGSGISVSFGSVVRGCVSTGNSGIGISVFSRSSVLDSVASRNTGEGIRVVNGLAARCVSIFNDGDGFYLASTSQATDCVSNQNKGDGFEATDDCYVAGNTSSNNGYEGADGAGIHLTGQRNRIERNHVTGANDRGLDIDGTGNVVRENTVHGNGDNYAIATGNRIEILLTHLPETIDFPALVRLAGTIQAGLGLTLTSNDITVDLNGHSLVGPGGTGLNYGINLSGNLQNITVKNGTIRSWGSHGINGVDDDRTSVHNIKANGNGGAGINLRHVALIEECTAAGNGAEGIKVADSGRVLNSVVDSNTGDGIVTGIGSQVSGSTSRLCAGDGIRVGNNSSVIACTVTDAGGASGPNTSHGIETGFVATVADCTVQSSTGDGINVNGGSRVSRCTTASNAADGIQLADEASAVDCTSNGNTGDGIIASNRTSVRDCQVANNGASGIWVSGTRNKIDGNNLVQNLRGIQTSIGGNVIIRNTASGNPAATSASNYVIAGTNEVGPIGGVAGGTNSTANMSY
jgi:parallel beta-helix repeat protein